MKTKTKSREYEKKYSRRISLADGSCVPAYTFFSAADARKSFSSKYLSSVYCRWSLWSGWSRAFSAPCRISCSRLGKLISRAAHFPDDSRGTIWFIIAQIFVEAETSKNLVHNERKTAPKWSKWRNWFMRTSWKVRARWSREPRQFSMWPPLTVIYWEDFRRVNKA